jgi:hypothetical protein
MWIRMQLRTKRGFSAKKRFYCWEAGEAVDLLFVPGGEGRMIRNAAIAAMIMTRITINTRDRDRLGLLSGLLFTGSICRWMRNLGWIREILGECVVVMVGKRS